MYSKYIMGQTQSSVQGKDWSKWSPEDKSAFVALVSTSAEFRNTLFDKLKTDQLFSSGLSSEMIKDQGFRTAVVSSIGSDNTLKQGIIDIIKADPVFAEMIKGAPKGDAGPQGPVGEQGPVGPAGIQGNKGDKGDTGNIGPVGGQGPAGAVGIQGFKGDTGNIGPVGGQGPAGAVGIQGIQGIKGDKGDIGPVGAPGEVTKQFLKENSLWCAAGDVCSMPGKPVLGNFSVRNLDTKGYRSYALSVGESYADIWKNGVDTDTEKEMLSIRNQSGNMRLMTPKGMIHSENRFHSSGNISTNKGIYVSALGKPFEMSETENVWTAGFNGINIQNDNLTWTHLGQAAPIHNQLRGVTQTDGSFIANKGLFAGENPTAITGYDKAVSIRNKDGSWTHFNEPNGGELTNLIRGRTEINNLRVGGWNIQENEQGQLVFNKIGKASYYIDPSTDERWINWTRK